MNTTEPITDSIYGGHLPQMEALMQEMLQRVEQIRAGLKAQLGMDPCEHCLARIKSEESMREKCRRKGLPENEHSALEELTDAIGLRIVCAFIDDVYAIRDALAAYDDCEVVSEKDYIRYVKPNGYRSYHMILKVRQQYYVEFQLRTISMDTWAALEHHMKYKKQVGTNQELIVQELKRCADELASTDISMQTLRTMILDENKSSEA